MRQIALCCALALGLTGLSHAEDAQPIRDLDGLLQHVRAVQADERARQQQRESEFLAERNEQQAKLEQARRAARAHADRTRPLQQAAEENRATIIELRRQLKQQLAASGDIHGVYREFAVAFASQLNASLTSTQFPDRRKTLEAIAGGEGEASIEQMQQMWLLLQEELTESGKVARYPAEVIDTDGRSEGLEVLRVGAFVATADGQFLRYVPETGELLRLSRQPARSVRSDMAALGEANPGELLTAHIDPSQGALLAMLVQSPDFWERVAQGKEIGYITLALGFAGLLIFGARLAWLWRTDRAVQQQMVRLQQPSADNPLGRVLLAAEGSGRDDEALQLILDDAVLKELPAIERGQSLLKLLAAVAPLLGLLGTVTGMIETFQAISLSGSGDPQLMAGGISQALVTTVIGLVVAIPLLFGHSLLATRSRALVQLLDEQSAGLLARRLEARTA